VADTRLNVHVTPRGSRNEIVGWRGNTLCVKITAPPVEGAANKAVVEFVAESLGIRRSAVEMLSGEKSREKTLLITGLTDSELRARLGV